MSPVFSINEIVRFAVEIEKEGILFYDKLTVKTKNNDLKEIFKQLSDDEKVHQAIYEALLSSLPEKEETLSQENEYTAYLHAMIKDAVFDEANVDNTVNNLADDLGAIEYAIGKEKDSIVFYLSLLKLVNKQDDIDNIEKIIREEQNHVLKLLDLKEKVD